MSDSTLKSKKDELIIKPETFVKTLHSKFSDVYIIGRLLGKGMKNHQVHLEKLEYVMKR